PSDAGPRLDDMADIYFRVRQYVDWLKNRVTPNTGPTAHFYTFASSDPVTHKDVDPNGAIYKIGFSSIVFGVAESEYENRDDPVAAGHDNDAPQNGEWHEFTHHLFYTWVHKDPCFGKPHNGYNNPDTCNSLDEGFAEFLPTLAAREIFGVAGWYDSMWNL